MIYAFLHITCYVHQGKDCIWSMRYYTSHELIKVKTAYDLRVITHYKLHRTHNTWTHYKAQVRFISVLLWLHFMGVVQEENSQSTSFHPDHDTTSFAGMAEHKLDCPPSQRQNNVHTQHKDNLKNTLKHWHFIVVCLLSIQYRFLLFLVSFF